MLTPFGGADGEGDREVRALPPEGSPSEGARGRAGVELRDALPEEYGSDKARPRRLGPKVRVSQVSYGCAAFKIPLTA